jgi:hypothetical protein
VASNCFKVEQIETARKASSNLVLNFSPVQFNDIEMTIGCLPYGQDGEQVLEQLRREHNRTHVFRRNGADRIVAVSVSGDAPLIGEPEAIRLKDHLGLAAALVRNALLTYLDGLGRTVMGYDPMRFIARTDVLREIQGISPPEWLALRFLYEVAIRPVYFFKRDPFLAAIVDVRTTRLIERTAWELIQDGFFPIEGFYVGKRVPGHDPRIAPRFESLGCVTSREGSELHLADSRDGIKTVDAREVWPEKSVFAPCLSHVFRERAPRILELIEIKRAALRQGRKRLDHIKGSQ